ncbi:MAG: hypothetical protein CL577_08865 [Alteromonadaceae bacterium]|jgi:DNA-binding winged helix-turn-helix (wHTH) protein|nr:hypothetical protein [Alteromonadaceae bacterium]
MFVYWVKLLMNLVSIGEFTVDLAERRIFKAEAELAAEPKVIEVLCYLIEHRERFVSLSELHDHVWAGRVVTDTAVRRTISKLRILLEDTDTDNARYIKSQMKRGYQIIEAQPMSAISSTENQNSELIKTELKGSVAGGWKNFIHSRYVYLAAIVCVFFIGLAVFGVSLSKLTAHERITLKLLLDIPGEKFSLTVSRDGRYQAFVGRLNNADKWQAYLNDSVTGQLSRLDVPGDTVYSLSFVGNRLAVVSYSNGIGSLYLNSADSFISDFQKIELNGFNLIDKVVALDSKRILVNAAENHESALLYYLYDLENHSVSQFSHSNNNNVRDYNAVKSPDSSLLALSRWDTSNKSRSIQIYNLVTSELIADWPLPTTTKIAAIEWISEVDILLATGTDVKELNINNGFIKEPTSYLHISGLAKDESGDLFALVNENSSLQVYETTIPYDEAFTRRFQLGDAVEQFYFSNTDGSYWLVEYLKDRYILSSYTAEGKTKSVFQSKDFFRVLDQATDKPLLLLRHNWQLQLFNTDNGDLIPVSIKTQSVEHASFNNDASSIYFSENIAGNWHINIFDFSTRLQKRLIEGYRAVVPYRDKFVAVAESGQVTVLNSSLDKEQQLPIELNLRNSYRIFIRDDRLIIVNRLDSSDWLLAQYNFTEKELVEKLVKSNQLGTEVSVDGKGVKLLYVKDKEASSKLVSLGYNFGYN